MKLFFICGNHPRHLYVLNAISEVFQPAASVIERRESMEPEPPIDLADRDQANFVRHFQDRQEAEQRYFGQPTLPPGPRLMVEGNELSGQPTADFVAEHAPDLVIVFGSGLIRDPLYSTLPRNTVNIHLGLSPRYRGAAGLFWPFYFLEPSYVGVTFHHIIAEPDAGEVIHQATPQLEESDGVHDVACKTVLTATEDVIRLLKITADGGHWKTHQQHSTGKNFLSTDFQAHHLRLIYDLFDDDIVAHYLAGRIAQKTPKLLKQF